MEVICVLLLSLPPDCEHLQEKLDERSRRIDELERKLALLARSHKEQSLVIEKQTEKLRASKHVQSVIQQLCGSVVIESPMHPPAVRRR